MENYFQEMITLLGFTVIKSEHEIDAIHNGLIHIHAVWSGPAIMRTKEIFELLKNLNLRESINLYYLDNDLIKTLKYIKLLNNHGYGETIIIKDGQIIYSTKFGKPLNELIDYIGKTK
ncbi:MAG: hypothetical protein H6581_03000 [Bacteroidia bacterium]|nr:hypothetical protein [Bacteroidia bacterium]